MKKVLGFCLALLCPCLVLAQNSNDQSVYASTDAEQLTRRLENIKKSISDKAEGWKTSGENYLLQRTEMEKAVADVTSNATYENQVAFLQAADKEAAKLQPVLATLVGDGNPQSSINEGIKTCDELVAICKRRAERNRALAANAPTQTLRDSYLMLADAADRMARAYQADRDSFAGFNIEARMGEFKGDLEFLHEYRAFCNELIPLIRGLENVGELLEQAKQMDARLHELAQAMVDFSKSLTPVFSDPSEPLTKS